MTEMPSFGLQVALLFILAIPIACVAWTLTHEEIFREPRERCRLRPSSPASAGDSLKLSPGATL